jgi:hypothetical protein
VESGKPSLNLGLIVPHSLFREKQYRYTIYGRPLTWSGRGEVKSGKPNLNLGLIVPHSLFREKHSTGTQ